MDAAFEKPHFYLAAYGLQGLWVGWAISRGALQDWAPVRVNEVDFGDAESRALALRAFPRLRIENRPVLR